MLKFIFVHPVDQKLRQTSVQPQTMNPIWDEYFKFGVAHETMFKTAKRCIFIFIIMLIQVDQNV